MSESKAVAVVGPKPNGAEAKADKIPAVQSMMVPAALLLAAESISAKADPTRAYLEGVYLHSKGQKGRIVASDGVRMFVASFALPPPKEGGTPAWLSGGIILSNRGLRARLSLMQKVSEARDVRVGFAKGADAAELSDTVRNCIFKMPTVAGEYPDYEAVIGAQSFVVLDDDGRAQAKEWQPVGINSRFLKDCADVAKQLEAGLDREERSVGGMVIRAFNGGDSTMPMIFDFSTWPGAILVVMPARLASNSTSKETAQLLAPAVKLTVAALRAHATRWQVKADESDGAEKVAAQAKADEFRARVDAILKLVPASFPQVSAKPQPEPEPQPQPEPEPQPEPDPQPGADAQPEANDTASHNQPQPRVRRTKIRPQAAA